MTTSVVYHLLDMIRCGCQIPFQGMEGGEGLQSELMISRLICEREHSVRNCPLLEILNPVLNLQMCIDCDG